MTNSFFANKTLVLGILLLLVAISACKKPQDSNSIRLAAMADLKKLVVEDKATKAKKEYKIPNIIRISIAPSGEKIACIAMTSSDHPLDDLVPPAYFDAVLKIVDLKTDKIIEYKSANPEVLYLTWSADSKEIFLAAGSHSAINVIDSTTGKYKHLIFSRYSYRDAIFMSPDTYFANFAFGDDETYGVVNVIKKGKVTKKIENVQQFEKIGDKLLIREENADKLQLVDSKTYKAIKSIQFPNTFYFMISPGEQKIMVVQREHDDWFPEIAGIDIYDANLKHLTKVPHKDVWYGGFVDEDTVDLRISKVNKKSGTGTNAHSLFNIKRKTLNELGDWRQTDWLTGKTAEQRTLKLPETGIEYYKGYDYKKGRFYGRIKP